MTNELIGIAGVLFITLFLLLLQHVVLAVGKRRRRAHGPFLMRLDGTDADRHAGNDAPADRDRQPGKLDFQIDWRRCDGDWLAPEVSAIAVVLAPRPQLRGALALLLGLLKKSRTPRRWD